MRSGEYAGVDWFRLPAALLVIAIHTAPLSGISPGLDAAVTYGLGRMAVPFFFMTTGYFLIGPCLPGKKGSRERYGRFEIKMLILYGAASVLYLPVAWYAGNLPENPGELARMVLFDGTFYHLWYFPALLLGGRFARGLGRLGKEKALALAGGLYLAGLLGDSYYGLTAQIPLLKAGYEALFQIMGYTRNGIFLAPLFLLLGAYMKEPKADKRRRTGRVSGDADGKTLTAAGVPMTLTAGVPMALTAGILMAEAFLVFRLGLARHDSMYLSLPAAMYVWYQGLLSAEGSAPRWLRDGTLCVYVIHPLVIILVRGAAKYTGTAALLVENPMVHYLAVCAGSLAAAALYSRGRRAAEDPPGRRAASAKRDQRRSMERTKKERG